MAAEIALQKHDTWDVGERWVDVVLVRGARKQRVYLSGRGDEYILKSVVLGAAEVTRSSNRWRHLAKLAWLRNVDHQLVTFAFDERDRLIGVIRHPKEQLDLEELEVYVDRLAVECDRFEYLLSGKDRH